jgi:hypothetical protein
MAKRYSKCRTNCKISLLVKSSTDVVAKFYGDRELAEVTLKPSASTRTIEVKVKLSLCLTN